MARRDVSDFRTVVNVVAENPDRTAEIAADLGQDIIRRSQEARIMEGVSAAQLELNALSSDFQKRYEADPFNEQGLKEYKEARQGIIDKHGSGVSQLFKRPWNESVMTLSKQNDLQLQAWGYRQAETNTRRSLDNFRRNYLNQAALDGESGGAIGNTLINFAQAKTRMEQFGYKNLGQASTDNFVKDFGQDWVKMFISGVARNNPVEALRLMESDEVKAEISDQADFAAFRSSIENLAINSQEVARKNEVLNVLKNENSLLASGKALSYAEIAQATDGMSESARDYFLRVNGFKKSDIGGEGAVDTESSMRKRKLTADEKFQEKATIYDAINQTLLSEQVDVADISKLQDRVYAGMRDGAISQEEGAGFITQLLNPLIEEQEGQLSQFSSGEWNPFKTDTGLPVLKEFYDNSVEIKPAEGEDAVGPISAATNARNKVKLYGNYFDALNTEASKRNIRVGDIPKQRDRDAIYRQAQAQAMRSFEVERASFITGIPIIAINELFKNPEPSAIKEFDEAFGNGAANRILNAGK